MRRRQQLGGRSRFCELAGLAILALAFLLFAPTSHAQKDWGTTKWTGEDTAWMLAYGWVRYVDMAQTRTCAKNPDRCEEVGLIAAATCGSHPSTGCVHNFNAAMIGLVWLGAWALGPPYRRWWQWGNTGAEVYVIWQNQMQGFGPDYPSVGLALRF